MNVFIKREYDYAIRICAYLASRFDRTPQAISEVSAKLYITRAFAHKIINQLKKSGIIATVQGKHGGIFLNKDPRRVSILDVLKAMNFNATMNECVLRPEICPLVVTCKIHRFFVQLDDQILQQLEEKKIADFAFGDAELGLKKAT